MGMSLTARIPRQNGGDNRFDLGDSKDIPLRPLWCSSEWPDAPTPFRTASSAHLPSGLGADEDIFIRPKFPPRESGLKRRLKDFEWIFDEGILCRNNRGGCRLFGGCQEHKYFETKKLGKDR